MSKKVVFIVFLILFSSSVLSQSAEQLIILYEDQKLQNQTGTETLEMVRQEFITPADMIAKSNERAKQRSLENRRFLYKLAVISGVTIAILFLLNLRDRELYPKVRRRVRRRILYILIGKRNSKGLSFTDTKKDLISKGWQKKHVLDAVYRYKKKKGIK